MKNERIPVLYVLKYKHYKQLHSILRLLNQWRASASVSQNYLVDVQGCG
jgi:hypothetical protein